MGFFSDMFKGSGGDLIGAAVSLGGSLLGANSSSNAAERNYAAQKEFAQNGIRWKVEDAKAAGIHPLAALGAHTASFSPVFQGSDYSGFSNAGQMISRAIEAKQTQAERELADLQVEHARLENEYTRAKIDDLKNQGVHRDFAAVQALDSANAARVQQRQPPMPTVSGPDPDVGTYGKPTPGLIPYIYGNSYMEFPPSDVADLMEDPKIFATFKAAVEGAHALSPKESWEYPLSKRHRKLIKAGTHEIVRIPGYGYAVKEKGKPNSVIIDDFKSRGIRGFYGG